MNVINLEDQRAAIQQARVEKILRTLETIGPCPSDLCVDTETGDLVATSESWKHFERLTEAFLLKLPTDINAQNAIAADIYLVGHLGSKIKLRANNERVYRYVQSVLSPLEQEFIESLFETDLNRPVHLIQQLGVFEKLPSDFA
jgi:hypothetical protein